MVKLLQDYYGVTSDGIWGAQSQAAGGTIEQAIANVLKAGETDDAKAFLRETGTADQWRSRGVDNNAYRQIALDRLGNTTFTTAEYLWLLDQFGLISLT